MDEKVRWRGAPACEERCDGPCHFIKALGSLLWSSGEWPFVHLRGVGRGESCSLCLPAPVVPLLRVDLSSVGDCVRVYSFSPTLTETVDAVVESMPRGEEFVYVEKRSKRCSSASVTSTPRSFKIAITEGTFIIHRVMWSSSLPNVSIFVVGGGAE